MEIQIERTQDAEVLAELNKSVQSLHHTSYPEEFKAFDLTSITKAFERMLSLKESYAYLASINSKPIGYIVCMVQ